MPRKPTTSSRNRARRRYRKRVKVTKTIKNYVSRAIQRNTENKRIIYSSNYLSFNNQINSASDLNVLLPTIGQGYASYQRIGTKIRIKKLVIRGQITMTGSATAGLQRFGVRQMIIKSKAFPNAQVLNNPGELNYLLETSGGGYQGFNGLNPDSLFCPVNRKAWAVARDKKHYMYMDSTNQATDDLSHASKYFSIDLKQARNKIINMEFESGTATNFGWFMAFGWNDLTNVNLSTTNTNISVVYTVDITYEDV